MLDIDRIGYIGQYGGFVKYGCDKTVAFFRFVVLSSKLRAPVASE